MRFLAILLAIGGLVYGWFYFQKQQVENRARAWAAQLVPHIADVPVSADATATAKKVEANVYWILFYFDKLVAAGMDPTKVFDDASDQISMPAEKVTVLRHNLLAIYETAKKYEVYGDITNVVKLEQGIAPLIKMAGWEDEPLALSYIIPPSLAPEAAGSAANVTLIPSIVNDAQSDRITPSMIEQARSMERAKIILKSSLEEILKQAKKPATEPR